MTALRLWPSTNGPSAAIGNGSNPFISGTSFGLKGGGNWLYGYWWWCCNTGQSTSPAKAALWSPSPTAHGGTGDVVIPASVATSGNLTPGAWNYIPLAQPIQLAPSFDPNSSVNGSAYIASVGFTGGFPDTSSYWGSGQPGAAGIVSGALVAYSAPSGSVAAPYSLSQGLFSQAGSDPSVSMPNQVSGTDNFWVDVDVRTTPPPGYTGSFRLLGSKGDSSPLSSLDASAPYNVGVELHLSMACLGNNVWFFSYPGAANLPTRADVWSIATQQPVATIMSPNWLTASGSAASPGTGWVSAAFPVNTIIPAGAYRVACFNGAATSSTPKDAFSGYWSVGVGSAGIVNGPISAPGLSAASTCWEYSGTTPGSTPPYTNGSQERGQAPFGRVPAGTVTFPQLYSDGIAENLWVDLEVTPLASGSGLLMASGII